MEKNEKLLLTEKEAAELLSMSTHFLRRDRITPHGVGVPFIRIGGAVRYQRGALEIWINCRAEKTEQNYLMSEAPVKKRGRGRPMKHKTANARNMSACL
jgi:hypothetical protein